MYLSRRRVLQMAAAATATLAFGKPRQREVSGVYPHLAMFNDGKECGTGAIVPWAGRLWAVTYSPHSPEGSSDKLYEIDADLNLTVRPESIGGTPANRMIHRESSQLFIGPYVIDESRRVRVIPYQAMFGRPTGNARHLSDPKNKIYAATMEEGFYEVDVHTLAVKQLYEDANAMAARKAAPDIAGPLLPGYHGKGLYSGQGRLVYANNGELGGAVSPPSIPSGCLAEWDGQNWIVVRRNQFTEVTGPGGITGNADPATDPIWSIGWDHRSLILMLRDKGQWHSYRLPKASHAYDGAHGWNTEWPRIRDIGENDLLMTMHGMFWRFPKSFSTTNSGGIRPRSTYLKVIGDFTRWNDRVVLGCDDTALSEFTNKRKAKGDIAGPGQSQSNLWFLTPERLDTFGPPIGRGAVWIDDDTKANTPSEPYLFAGFESRAVHLTHGESEPVTFTLEVDSAGGNSWEPLQKKVNVPAGGCEWIKFDATEKGEWVRIRTDRDCRKATALFQFANRNPRKTTPDSRFSGLVPIGDGDFSGGLLWARGDNRRTLLFAARRSRDPKEELLYELDADLKLRRIDDNGALQWMRQNVAIPTGVLKADDASVIYTDETGNQWRLPKLDRAFETSGVLGDARVAREVSTERDLLNAHGTLYELPAENAGGIRGVRPIATSRFRLHDYCSFRGLMVVSGVAAKAAPSANIVRSEDGKVALWVGVSDDLWDLGKPGGHGGPWKNTHVQGGIPSDPYLITGYETKTVALSQTGAPTATFTLQIDLTGFGLWRDYKRFTVPSGKTIDDRFPDGYHAYWLRVVSDKNCAASVQLSYS